jgi:hypothetical protein
MTSLGPGSMRNQPRRVMELFREAGTGLDQRAPLSVDVQPGTGPSVYDEDRTSSAPVESWRISTGDGMLPGCRCGLCPTSRSRCR